VAPLLVLNGPVARELSVQAGYNAFGQGFRANVTIGRAVRLVLMNVGGGLPGPGDRATLIRQRSRIASPGAGKHSSWQPTFGDASHPVRRIIARRDGSPVRRASDLRR
jgi:hypothetical protein